MTQLNLVRHCTSQDIVVINPINLSNHSFISSLATNSLLQMLTFLKHHQLPTFGLSGEALHATTAWNFKNTYELTIQNLKDDISIYVTMYHTLHRHDQLLAAGGSPDPNYHSNHHLAEK